MFFDTNILIDWLFDRGNARAELKLHSRRRISRIVWAELLSGEPPDRRPPLLKYLDRFEVVEVDESIAAIAVDFRQRTNVKLLDSLIYATAQQHGALLATRNTRDFPPGTPGIHVPYTL
jgi:predicted nucleic acid-binding protein